MILGWLGNVLFAKRERKAVVLNLSNKCLYQAATVVELHNAKCHANDHISLDDIFETGGLILCQKALKLNYEEDDLPQPQKPPALSIQPNSPLHRGRRQLTLEEYRN